MVAALSFLSLARWRIRSWMRARLYCSILPTELKPKVLKAGLDIIVQNNYRGELAHSDTVIRLQVRIYLFILTEQQMGVRHYCSVFRWVQSGKAMYVALPRENILSF